MEKDSNWKASAGAGHALNIHFILALSNTSKRVPRGRGLLTTSQPKKNESLLTDMLHLMFADGLALIHKCFEFITFGNQQNNNTSTHTHNGQEVEA